MKIFIPACYCLLLGCCSWAQVTRPPAQTTEQQLEMATENNENREPEDDDYPQQLQHYLTHPLNLNTATVKDLMELPGINALQAAQLVTYREALGPFISIYEIQAVPSWGPELFSNIRPYITVSLVEKEVKNLGKRIKKGDHQLLLRLSQVLEKSKGYLQTGSATKNFYPGSPQKILLRYQYNYKNIFQYGLLAEKDAGEHFFKGTQKQGFDFYSFHVFARGTGIIKTLALGDFTVNMGQGLVQWQGLAFGKSAEVMNIKREAAILRPYRSSGEINFHRGAGITLQKWNWQGSLFFSYKKIDANLLADSTDHGAAYVSSLQNSGYHRTKSETDDKGIQRQLVWGANLSWQYRQLHLGINAVDYQFKLPVKKADLPYQQYSLTGRSFTNYSLDYSYTYKNLHVFGELAFTKQKAPAFTSGILVSVSGVADLSLLYRHISPSYQSFYSSAFTESYLPQNESGIYMGLTVRPNSFWKIDAVADFYSFPWLKYRVDKPSMGADWLVQLTYKPNKKLELYSRYKHEAKSININPDDLTLAPVMVLPRQNWRTHINFILNPSFTLRNRLEMVWFDKKGKAASEGFLAFTDLLFKPLFKPYSANIRLQYFETEGYNSRIYAYENDVLYSFSIPFFYDKGYRYYININYDINKKLTLWLRCAQTVNKNKNLIGSGLDEISGQKKTEVRLQAIYRF